MQRHSRVLEPAVFSALPAIRPSESRVEPDRVRATGHEVDLAVEARYPEAVDDVGRSQCHAYRLADGDMDFVGGDDAQPRVSNLPPPLPADELDVVHTAARGRFVHGHGPHGGGEE